MSMEESFIRGCYYYMADNSIWYIYRARMANYVVGRNLLAEMRRSRSLGGFTKVA